jgi:hypothetical protein
MKFIDLIKEQNAHFRFIRFGIMFYETDNEFLFEVPVADIDNGTFDAHEKATTLMKWIKRQYDKNEKMKINGSEEDGL